MKNNLDLKKMKLLFDNQCFYFNGIGGVSRFFNEIITQLNNKENINIEFESQKTHNFFNANKNKGWTRVKGIRRLNYEFNKRSNQKHTLNKLNKNSIDFFIPSYYDTYYINHLKNTKLVLVIHDFICEKYNLNIDEIKRKKILIEKADIIITVSNTTKTKLLNYYPKLNTNHIHTVYHGESISNLKANRVSISGKFILYVGSRNSYKNFIKLIEEINPYLNANKDLKLVCVGGGKWNSEEYETFKNFNINYSQINQINTNDNELKWLYQNAEFYISPSLDEGFGIPVIEAMANNCLAVLNNIDVYQEITKGSAIFFNIDKKNNLHSTLINLSELEKQNIITQAKKMANNYNWSETVKKIQSILINHA